MKNFITITAIFVLSLSNVFGGDWREDVLKEEKSNFEKRKLDEISINWLSPQEAFNRASHSNKLVFTLIYSEECPVCFTFLKDFLMSKEAKNTAVSNFEMAAISVQNAIIKFPQFYKTDITPTIFIYDKAGNLVVEPIKGAPNDMENFNNYLSQVVKQYRNLKEKNKNDK